jgi:hypothetical protein
MEATEGTLNVVSPWLDRDKYLQESFHVFFQSRTGKLKKGSEESSEFKKRSIIFPNFVKEIPQQVTYKTFLRTVPISRPTNI